MVYDNRFGSTICYTAYLLWQRGKIGTRPRSASRGTSHWYSTVSLLVSSLMFPVAALNPLLPHLGGIFFSLFFPVFLRHVRPAACSRGTAAYLTSFFVKYLERLDPVFYGISAVHRKVPGAPTPGFHQTSSPRQLKGQGGLAEMWGSGVSHFGIFRPT